MDKQFIFPTQVFRAVYDDAENLRSKIVPLFLQKEKDDTSPIRYTANGYTSYGMSNILDIPDLEDLKTFIDTTVAEAHRDIKLAMNPKLSASWFSVNRKYTYHEAHNHLPDIWSGVYYVQADQDHPGLTLVNKNRHANWPKCGVTELHEANTPQVTCGVETGSLLIFPSYLEHKVEQQMVEKERITIAFNYGVN